MLRSIDAKIRAQLAAERHRRHKLARSDGPTGGGTSSNVFFGDVTWYGPGFAGQTTADGEKFDPHKLTAASPWLPFNTMLRVTSTVTGRSVVVRVNDRGPFGHGVLDLSAHAAPHHRPVRLAALPDAAVQPYPSAWPPCGGSRRVPAPVSLRPGQLPLLARGGDQALGDVRRHLLVAQEAHRVVAAAARHRVQVGRVGQHLGHRHVGVDRR